MSFKINQKGFSLIETLFVLAIFAAISVMVINNTVEKTRIESGERFGKKLTDIIKAIDNRLVIEGYEESLWVDMSGDPLDTTVVYDLINFTSEQLYSDNHSCVASTGSAWVLDDDLIADNASYGLTSCNIFPANRYDFKITTVDVSFETITYSGMDSIKKIAVDFDIFPIYEEYMKELIAAVNFANKTDIQNVSGQHLYGFYDLDTGTKIAAPSCLKNLESGNSCVLRAEIDTLASDGSQYSKVNGANPYMGSVGFKADPSDRTTDDRLMDCYVWHYDPILDGIGGWTNYNPDVDYNATTLETTHVSLPCGLRYDSIGDGSGGEQKIINLAVNNVTSSDTISLSKTCDADQFSIDPLYKVNTDFIAGNDTFNCGIFRNKNGDNLVIALVEDIYAMSVNALEANINTVNSREIFSTTAEINTVTTQTINGMGGILGIDSDSINITSDDITISAVNSINLSGIVNLDDKIFTNQEINEFTEDKELVSKEYVDQYTGKYVSYVNNNSLHGETITGNTRDTTNANVFCAEGETEKAVVSPVQTHSEPIVLTYTVERNYSGSTALNSYDVVIVDGDGAPDYSAKANVVVFCEK